MLQCLNLHYLNFLLAFAQKTKTHALTAYNTEVDGVPAFDTNDLVQRHPKNHSLYRVVGRADDQIMLSTGEKVESLQLAEFPSVLNYISRRIQAH